MPNIDNIFLKIENFARTSLTNRLIEKPLSDSASVSSSYSGMDLELAAFIYGFLEKMWSRPDAMLKESRLFKHYASDHGISHLNNVYVLANRFLAAKPQFFAEFVPVDYARLILAIYLHDAAMSDLISNIIAIPEELLKLNKFLSDYGKPNLNVPAKDVDIENIRKVHSLLAKYIIAETSILEDRQIVPAGLWNLVDKKIVAEIILYHQSAFPMARSLEGNGATPVDGIVKPIPAMEDILEDKKEGDRKILWLAALLRYLDGCDIMDTRSEDPEGQHLTNIADKGEDAAAKQRPHFKVGIKDVAFEGEFIQVYYRVGAETTTKNAICENIRKEIDSIPLGVRSQFPSQFDFITTGGSSTDRLAEIKLPMHISRETRQVTGRHETPFAAKCKEEKKDLKKSLWYNGVHLSVNPGHQAAWDLRARKLAGSLTGDFYAQDEEETVRKEIEKCLTGMGELDPRGMETWAFCKHKMQAWKESDFWFKKAIAAHSSLDPSGETCGGMASVLRTYADMLSDWSNILWYGPDKDLVEGNMENAGALYKASMGMYAPKRKKNYSAAKAIFLNATSEVAERNHAGDTTSDADTPSPPKDAFPAELNLDASKHYYYVAFLVNQASKESDFGKRDNLLLTAEHKLEEWANGSTSGKTAYAYFLIHNAQHMRKYRFTSKFKNLIKAEELLRDAEVASFRSAKRFLADLYVKFCDIPDLRGARTRNDMLDSAIALLNECKSRWVDGSASSWSSELLLGKAYEKKFQPKLAEEAYRRVLDGNAAKITAAMKASARIGLLRLNINAGLGGAGSDVDIILDLVQRKPTPQWVLEFTGMIDALLAQTEGELDESSRGMFTALVNAVKDYRNDTLFSLVRKNSYLCWQIAEAHSRLGKWAEAAELLKMAAEIEASCYRSKTSMSTECRAEFISRAYGTAKSAITGFLKKIADNEEKKRVKYILMALAKQARDANPNNPRNFTDYADELMSNGQWGDAKEQLEKAVEIYGAQGLAALWGQSDKALFYSEAGEINKECNYAFWNIGECLRGLKRPGEAIQYWEIGAETKGDPGEYLFLLKRLLGIGDNYLMASGLSGKIKAAARKANIEDLLRFFMGRVTQTFRNPAQYAFTEAISEVIISRLRDKVGIDWFFGAYKWFLDTRYRPRTRYGWYGSMRLKFVEDNQAATLDEAAVNLLIAERMLQEQIAMGLKEYLEVNLRQRYLCRARLATLQPKLPSGPVKDLLKGYLWLEFPDQSGIEKVAVAGSFNNWCSDSGDILNYLAMRKNSSGLWRVAVNAGTGSHLYKYIVTQGGSTAWVPDPQPIPRVSDGCGGENSVLAVIY